MIAPTEEPLIMGTNSFTRTDKIRIIKMVIAQMNAMVKVNQQQIDLGDDVEARTHLIEILQDEIRKNNLKIDKLMRGEQLKLTHFQRWSDEEDI